MQGCLQLAQEGIGHVAPNPLVGAQLVRDDHVIGAGFHREYGSQHAEVEAIEAAGKDVDLSDTTLYVNLEPCLHEGKTPPCCDLIIAREIQKVVVGSLDPNPAVQGRGVARLREAGIAVSTDILRAEEAWLLPSKQARMPFFQSGPVVPRGRLLGEGAELDPMSGGHAGQC